MGMIMPIFFMIRVVMVMIPMWVRMVMAFIVFAMAVGMLVIMGVGMVMRMVVFVFPVAMVMVVIMAVVVVMIVFVFVKFNFHFDSPYKVIRQKRWFFFTITIFFMLLKPLLIIFLTFAPDFLITHSIQLP